MASPRELASRLPGARDKLGQLRRLAIIDAQHCNSMLKAQCPNVLTQNSYKWRKCSINVWKNDFKNSS